MGSGRSLLRAFTVPTPITKQETESEKEFSPTERTLLTWEWPTSLWFLSCTEMPWMSSLNRNMSGWVWEGGDGSHPGHVTSRGTWPGPQSEKPPYTWPSNLPSSFHKWHLGSELGRRLWELALGPHCLRRFLILACDAKQFLTFLKPQFSSAADWR